MSGQTVVADVYLLPDKVVVDLHQRNDEVPHSIDELLPKPITKRVQRVASRSLPVDNEEVLSPQGLYTFYSMTLDEHFGQQVLFNGNRDVFWSNEEPRVNAHVTEYAAFSYKHIKPLHCEDSRLVHCVISPQGKPAKEVYNVIVSALKAREK